MFKICYRNWVSSIEANFKRDSYGFYKFVRNYKSIGGIPTAVGFNDQLYDNIMIAANMFSHNFSSIYISHNPLSQTSSVIYPQHDLPNNVYFIFENVYNSLVFIRDEISKRPDSLSGNFLFNLRDMIAGILWFMFRKLLDKRMFPSLFKLCSIMLISKFGDVSKLILTD